MQVKETSQGSQLPISYSSDCLLSRVGRPGLTKSRWFKLKRFCISLPSVRDKPTPYCHRTCALESNSTLYVQFYLLCALFIILIYRSHSELPGGSRTWSFTVLHVLCPSPGRPFFYLFYGQRTPNFRTGLELLLDNRLPGCQMCSDGHQE